MTCYLCGSPNPTTRDHVPPKCFFPEPRPSNLNLITVPCCESCNHGFSLDDEAARAWFCMGLGHSDAANWIVENKLFHSTFTRSRAFCHEIRDSMIDTLIHNEEGQPIKVVQYSMDRERTERFVIRTVKGLLKHYFPDYDSSADRWLAHYLGLELSELSKFEHLRDSLPCLDQRGDGVISYRFGFMADGKTGLWLVVFYETAMFFVTHTANERLIEAMEAAE